jgi:ATP-dependent helicase/nuclease subunit B
MFRGITILAGPARCGKTHRLLDVYRRVLADGPVGAALWLSPTQRSAGEIRRQLASGPLAGCFSPHCLTFDQFGRRVLEASPREIRPIGQPLARQILRRLVRESVERGAIRYFAPISHTSGFLDLLVEFIQELKRLEIWPEELHKACRDRAAEKDRELCHLYSRYQQLLTEHDLYDAQGRFWAARAVLREGQRKPFERLQHVFVDGFTDFTRTEHDILEILATHVESLTISLTLDPDLRRGGLFAKTTKTVDQLRLRYPHVVLEHMEPRATAWPAMDHLERQVFVNPRHRRPLKNETGSEPDQAKSVKSDVREVPVPIFQQRESAVAGDACGIEIVPAAGVTHEVELLAHRIKQLIVRGDSDCPGERVPPGDILVVFRSLHDTADRVQEVFGQFGIPVSIGAHPPLEREPITSALLSWLRLDLEDWPFRQVPRVLAHNYFRPGWPEWNDGRATAAAERLVHHLQIPSGREKLIASIRRLSKPSPTADVARPSQRRAALSKLATLALPLVTRMARVLDDLPQRATLTGWSAAITSLAEATGMFKADVIDPTPGASFQQVVWQQLVAALHARDHLSRWLGEEPALVSRREFYEQLLELFRSEPSPRVCDETGCVRVLPAENARNLSVPYVFVAGLSEQAFPSSHREDCIYSEAETRQLAAAGLPLVPHADRRGYEMLLFYEVITRATRRLVLSYPALEQSGQPLSPSPYLTEVELALGAGKAKRSQQPELTSVPASNDVFSPRDFRVRAVAQALSGDGDMLARLYGHPSTATSAANIVAGLQVCEARRRGASFGPYEGILPSAPAGRTLRARFGSDRCWSPSQLEQYARCPYHFFLASVLELEPLDEPALEVDYLARGRILHWVLSEAHRRFNRRAGAPCSPAEQTGEEFLAEVGSIVEELLGRLRGDEALKNGLLEIDARQVTAWLGDYRQQHARYDAQWQTWSAPPRPAYFEVGFGPQRGNDDVTPTDDEDDLSSPEPFALECGPETIRFSGRIDRIDIGEMAGQTVFSVVDYKSGRWDRARLNAVSDGYLLQLPLYALAAEQLLTGRDAVPLRAAYWHVSDQGYKEVIKFHTNDDGELAINPDWETLRSELKLRVRSLVEGIRRGQFPMASADDRCTSYCPYSTVCRVNQVRSLEKSWQPPREDSP